MNLLFKLLIVPIVLLLGIGCSESPAATKSEDVISREINEDSVRTVFEVWLTKFEQENSIRIEKADRKFKVKLVDLNDDGFLDGLVQIEGAVPFDAETNGPNDGGQNDYALKVGLVYFENTESGLIYSAMLDFENEFLGELAAFNLVSVDKNTLEVEVKRLNEGDASCCPSYKLKETYNYVAGTFSLINVEEDPTRLDNEYYTYGDVHTFEGKYTDFSFGDLAHYDFVSNTNEEMSFNGTTSYGSIKLTITKNEYEEVINKKYKGKTFKILYREYEPRKQEEFMYPYTGITAIFPVE